MSGGKMNYAYAHVDEFARELEHQLEQQGQPNGWGGSFYTYTSEVQAEFQRIIEEAKRLAFEMREVEWLASGDTGEEAFLRQIKKGPRR